MTDITEGPWIKGLPYSSAKAIPIYIEVPDARKGQALICTVSYGNIIPLEEAHQNAWLICAAFRLLQAVEKTILAYDKDEIDIGIEELRAAAQHARIGEI